MSRLSQQLETQFNLMVSLPRNEPALARAAVESGATSLKVHVNCHHFASGTTFGSWNEEQGPIREILASVDVPVGIVTGEEVQPSAQDLTDMKAAGLDFWDLFCKFTPASHMQLPMGRMVAVDSSWTPELMNALACLGVQIIEGSVIPRTEYRSGLNLVDLATYHRLCRASAPMPVLIPTQKAIHPTEVALLRRAGAAGLTIGAVVTGLEESSLREATAGFAQAIASL